MDGTLTIREMLARQVELQEKYREKWGGLSPAVSVEQMLWAYGEMAEAADLLKKKGVEAVSADPALRRHFMEELGDAMMYLMDVLLCFDMTAEEFSEIYREKCARNLGRW
jgi:NTP pyrophosphatase (non-canonical NTP hydrolase)